MGVNIMEIEEGLRNGDGGGSPNSCLGAALRETRESLNGAGENGLKELFDVLTRRAMGGDREPLWMATQGMAALSRKEGETSERLSGLLKEILPKDTAQQGVRDLILAASQSESAGEYAKKERKGVSNKMSSAVLDTILDTLDLRKMVLDRKVYTHLPRKAP